MRISHFGHAFDNEPTILTIEPAVLANEPDLVQGVTDANIKQVKEAGEAMSPGIFEGPRADENVRSATALMLDFDKGADRQPGLTAAEVVTVLVALPADVEMVVHDSFSSGYCADDRRKFRVVLPFETELSVDEYLRLWDATYEALPVKPDRMRRHPGGLFFLPRIPAEHRDRYVATYRPGPRWVPTIPAPIVRAVSRSLNDVSSTTGRTQADWFKYVQTAEEKHDALNRAAFAVAGENARAGRRNDVDALWSLFEAALQTNKVSAPVKDWGAARGTVVKAIADAVKQVELDRVTAATVAEPVIAVLVEDARPAWELTEVGLARQFAEHYRDVCAFVPGHGWRMWSETHWCDLGRATPTEAMADMLDKLGDKLTTDGDLENAKKVRAFKKGGTIGSVLGLAERYMVVASEDWDRRPYLLACRNGTVDLRTGHLRKTLASDRLTRCCPFDFDPLAVAPRWETALGQMQRLEGGPIGGPDLGAVEYLRLLLGSYLVGEAVDGVTIFYGNGFDGKSTILQVLHKVMGNHARACSNKIVLATKNGQQQVHTSIVGGLIGARLAFIDELPADGQLDMGSIKAIFGRLPTRVQAAMRQDFVDVTLSAKLLIATNHLPRVDERDKGTLRRIRIIPFDGNLEGQGVIRDDEFPAKLVEDEGSGILNWLVGGCRDWIAAGKNLPRCDRFEQSTLEFAEEGDPVAAFLEKCEINRQLFTSTSEIYKAFSDHCEESGDYQLSKRAFSNRLREKGFKPARVGDARTRGYIGIGVKARVGSRLKTDYDKN